MIIQLQFTCLEKSAEMAADSSLREQQAPNIKELGLSNCDLEVYGKIDVNSDDNINFTHDDSDKDTSDDNNDDEEDGYLEGLEDLELKDLDADGHSLLQSVLYEDTTCSDEPDDTGATDPEVTKSEKEDDTHSEERKKIIKEIREEIENKIREEMKSEFNYYHEGIKALEAGQMDILNGGDTEAENLEGMEPKLREAVIKMRKLDKILLEKIQIEKQVKRDRILLEKRMRQEIAEITKGVNVHRDVKINTERFLALEPPPSHNEGVILDEGEEDRPPLFQTQISESEVLWRKNNGTLDPLNEEARTKDTTETNRTESVFKKSSRSSSSQPDLEAKGRKQKKDFIKRNKELAANADQFVAMTDDEKKRLAELLEGIDELPEAEEALGEDNASQSNAFQLNLHPGEGYCPDKTEMKSLTDIDERLKTIMPEEDYLSFVQHSDASPRLTPQALFNYVGSQTSDMEADQPERYGERVLYETKDERELKARLESIEQELDKFKALNEDASYEECHLTDEQLDSLLDQCVRNLSLCPETQDLSARSTASSRISLLENPPKLTDEQLQQLLSEAHFPMSARLLALREDEDNILEDEGNTEAIRAETWKAIKDIDLDEQDVADMESLSLAIINDDLESVLDTADNINLNVSNNHNKNISTNNNETSTHGNDSGRRSGDFLSLPSPTAYSAFDLLQTSVYSGPVANSMHSTSSGLPRISQSNGVSRSESFPENRSSSGTPIFFSRDSTEDTIKLPNISAKSFLVHAQQGMNNTTEKDRNNLPTRQPPQMMCNELSDMRVDSVSSDKEGERGQIYGCKSSSRCTLSSQPRLTLPKDRQSNA